MAGTEALTQRELPISTTLQQGVQQLLGEAGLSLSDFRDALVGVPLDSEVASMHESLFHREQWVARMTRNSIAIMLGAAATFGIHEGNFAIMLVSILLGGVALITKPGRPLAPVEQLNRFTDSLRKTPFGRVRLMIYLLLLFENEPNREDTMTVLHSFIQRATPQKIALFNRAFRSWRLDTPAEILEALAFYDEQVSLRPKRSLPHDDPIGE